MVDFVLASKKARSQKNLLGFKVEDLNIFSDHRPISISLTKNTTQEADEKICLERLEKRIKMPEFNDIYTKNIDSEEVGKSLTSVMDRINGNISEGSSLSNCISDLEEVMVASMGGTKMSSGSKNLTKRKPVHKTTRKNIWFDEECRKLKNGLKHICTVLNKNPNDGNLRKQFYDTRRNYKRLMKSKRLDWERKKIEEMEMSAYKGRDFWKDFKRIRNPKQDEALPNPPKIQTFFENLYTLFFYKQCFFCPGSNVA